MDSYILDRDTYLAKNTTRFKTAVIFMGDWPYSCGDYIYNGLSLLLGPENVHCFPFTPFYDAVYDIDRNPRYMNDVALWRNRQKSFDADRMREIMKAMY